MHELAEDVLAAARRCAKQQQSPNPFPVFRRHGTSGAALAITTDFVKHSMLESMGTID